MGRIQHCICVQKSELLDSEKKKNGNVSHGYVESLILVGAHEHLAGSIHEVVATVDVAGVAARREACRIGAHALRTHDDLARNLILKQSDKQQPTATTLRHRKQTPPKGTATKHRNNNNDNNNNKRTHTQTS